jgi:DNA invertase Pin-like site-specific DNA recombinase
MKNIVIYKRVSTDEQAEHGFSLDAQEEKVTKYCSNNGINVLKIFSEDYSAWKGFERPAYKELKTFLKTNKGKVDGILFTQWSRFSRDITESYNEIKRLKEIGVEPNAIEQWINFSIPENQYLLAIYLAAPQVENDRLSDRTKDGMNQALKQGRWLWHAPFGYINNKITKLIEVDEQAAKFVIESFQLMKTGLMNAEEARLIMKRKGFEISKQGFLSMLENRFYIGKIKIKAYKDEPEHEVQGLHNAIIDELTFDEVQFNLNGRKKSYKGVTKNTETPLVGILYCPECNRAMTGSGSKGNGGVYHYYHCQRAYGCKNSIPARFANRKFYEYLGSFQPQTEMAELYLVHLEEQFKNGGAGRESEKIRLKNEINRLEQSLNNAAIKNVNNVIDDNTYFKVKAELEAKKTEFQVKLNSLNALQPEFSSYIQNSSSLIKNLVGFYEQADVEIKKKLIGSIFTGKIYFENNNYRTTKINEAIELIFNIDKGLNENCSAKNAEQSSVAPSSIQFSNQISIELLKINELKKIIPLTYIHSLSQTS